MTRKSLCNPDSNDARSNVLKEMAGIRNKCLSELVSNGNIPSVTATLKTYGNDQGPAPLGIDELNTEGLVLTLAC